MAKPNYQYEKRQKDLAKKKKQEEKRQKKSDKNGVSPDEAVETVETGEATSDQTPDQPE